MSRIFTFMAFAACSRRCGAFLLAKVSCQYPCIHRTTIGVPQRGMTFVPTAVIMLNDVVTRPPLHFIINVLNMTTQQLQQRTTAQSAPDYLIVYPRLSHPQLSRLTVVLAYLSVCKPCFRWWSEQVVPVAAVSAGPGIVVLVRTTSFLSYNRLPHEECPPCPEIVVSS